MKTKHHLGRTLALILMGLFALLWGGLRTRWVGEKVCGVARQRLPGLLGMDVGLGQCQLDPLRGGIELMEVRLSAPGASEPLLSADKLLVRLRTFDFFSGKIRLERIEVERPRVQLDLSQPQPDTGNSSGCFLNQIRRIQVDDLSLNGAEIELRLPEGRSVALQKVDVDVRFTRGSYAVRVSVPQGEIDTGRVKLPLSKLRLASSLDVNQQKLLLSRLEAAAGELALFLRGEINHLCEPNLALEASFNVPLDLVSAILGPDAPKMSGNATVLVKRAQGTLADPYLEAEVTLAHARVENFDIGDAYLEAHLDKHRATIDKLEVSVGNGKARVKGTVDLGKGFPVRLSVDLDRVEFGRLLDKLTVHHSWVDFTASGRVEVKGRMAPFQLTGPAALEVRDFRLYDRGWDTGPRSTLLGFDRSRIELQADFNKERVRLSRAHVHSDRSVVDTDVSLFFDSSKGIDLKANIKQVDLSELRQILGIPWDGKLTGEGTIQGPFSQLRIDALASMRDFKFHKLVLGNVETPIRLRGNTLAFPAVVVHKGKSRFTAEGEFDLAGSQPRVRATGSFADARLSDLVEMVGDEHWVFAPLRGSAQARLGGTASISGRLLAPETKIDLNFGDMTYQERRLGNGEFSFRSENGERIIIEKLNFDGPCGPIAFSGKIELDQFIAFKLSAPRLVVSELAKPNGESLQSEGTLAIEADIGGPPDHVEGKGKVEAKGIAVLGASLGDGVLDLALDRTMLSLKGPLGSDLLLDARMDFEGGLPFALGVSASISNLGRYLTKVPGLNGALSGELLATGSLTHYEQIRGDIRLSKLSLGRGDYQAQTEGPVTIAFNGGVMEIQNLLLRGPANTRLSVSGVKNANGQLDLTLAGAFDARLVESFTPLIEQAGGRVDINANITGPVENPTVVGSASIQNGRFGIHGYSVNARGVEGQLEFSQNRIFLSNVEATVNGGHVEVQGEVEMKNHAPHRLDLSATVNEVQLRYPQTFPTTYTGSLDLHGLFTSLLLSGELNLVRLHYTENIDIETFLRDSKRRKLEPRNFEKQDEFLRYDILVHVPGSSEARVDNNVVKASVKGDLRVIGTNVNTGMVGTLVTEDGGVGWFRGNEFSISRGSLRFSERDRVAPEIDAFVQGQIRDYKVNIHIHGPFDNPKADLSSEPSLAETDIVSLLTYGFTNLDRGSNSAGIPTVLFSELSNSMLRISGVDRQLKKYMPKNSVVRDLKFNVSSQYSEVTGTVEPSAQLETKMLNDSLTLRVSRPIVSGRGLKAQTEYRINERMSTQAQWDNSDSSYTYGDLGIDLKLRWELE